MLREIRPFDSPAEIQKGVPTPRYDIKLDGTSRALGRPAIRNLYLISPTVYTHISARGRQFERDGGGAREQALVPACREPHLNLRILS